MSRKRAVLCGLVLAWVCVSESHSSFFVARRYREYNYFCVTNTSFAMSWIIETVTEGLQQNSVYIPESRSSFNYNIKNDWNTKNYFIKRPWSLQSSASEIILDERWEEMKVIKTEFVNGNNKLLKFVPLELSTANFDIALSIRIEKEGHIFLCDDEYPSISNCYWLMLQAFSGSGSAIRKCNAGEVSSIYYHFPGEPCSIKKVFVNHTLSQFPHYLSNLEWSHFLLSKEDGKLTFSLHSDDNKIYKILDWQDTETPIDVTHMIFHSKMVNGLWKIHNIDYIAATIQSNEIELGPLLYAREGSVCISMYVSMCQFCKLKLSLRGQYSIINNMIYEPEHIGWNQIKFITENLSNDDSPMQLLVSTVSGHPSPYWAIDKIRFCRQEEFRKIGLTDQATCQLMSGKGNVVTFQEQPAISGSNCPENTIGPFCVKCNLIFDNCERTRICTKDRCVCSAGYYSTECYHKCSSWYYGHGCQNFCETCYYPCDNIDGTCDLCTREYSGPKCDIPPVIIFANAPTVTDITYDGATISVSDFKIANRQNDQQPSHYLVQYKKSEEANSTWISYNKTFRFDEPSKFKINNLNTQTEYLVRSVIVTTTGQQQIGEHLKTNTFTTTCQDISDDNISIEPYNASVSITLIQTTGITCKSYRMSLFEIQRQSFTHNNGTTSFENLEPFTEYTLRLYGPSQTHTKKFMTTEGVPAPIQSFIISDLTSSSVELKWSTPKFNGQFKEYIVEYQHISYTACANNPSRTSTKNKKTTTEARTVLTDLKPYSTYQISVFAVNTKFDGPPHSQQVHTSAANTVDLEEVPKIFNITSDHNTANLALTEMNCEKIHGPLTIEPTIKCISEWCTDQNREAKTEIIYPPTSLITLYSLAPFSDYEVELKFCRGTGPCDFSEKKTFKTRPTVPGNVQDLLIYTKNESSISLRWEPPSPPTGSLKNYKIVYRYYYQQYYRETEVFGQAVQCKLWPEFHCATLSDLVKDTYYRIEVSARNEDPADFGPSQETATLAKTEESKAPYDLKVKWTQQNDLLLEWKHPNQTNGDIQYFGITISTQNQYPSFTKRLKITVDMYNLTYFYQINATEFTPTRRYRVSVFAFNGQAGYNTLESTLSPPDIPTLSSDPEFEGFNDTIQVTLLLNEPQGASSYYRLIILRTEYDAKSVESIQELKKYDLQNLRLVLDCDVSASSSYKLILGDNQETQTCHKTENPPLKPETEYNITIILINTYNDYRRDRIYSYSYRTLGVPPDMPTLKEQPIPHIFNRTIRIPIFLNDIQGKTDRYRIIILRSDKETNVHSYKELDDFDLGNLRVVIDCNFTNINSPVFFVILGRPQPSTICQDISNFLLEPATSYNVTIILMNTFHGVTRTNIYSLEIKTESESNLSLFALFTLLLVIPAAGTFYYYKKRKAAETKNRDVQGFIKDDSILSNGEVKTENVTLEPLQTKNKKISFVSNNYHNSSQSDCIVNFSSSNKSTANVDEIPKDHLKLVTVKNFSNYLKASLDNQKLKNQYETILETNLMYETVIGDSLRSEYLDMNFNSGLQIKNAYLITKFPAIAEFNEFWKIILDESIDHIVLFAHLHPDQKKTKNYWPEVGQSLRCGDVIIECNMCQEYTFYIRRKFTLKCENKIRKVDQLHLCLPQNDRRFLSSLNYVQFFLELLKIPLCSRTPILVHSSSGMRGNGFALLCDISLRSAQKDGAIDVMEIFKTLVQTIPEVKIEFAHYVAAHAIIADTLNHLDTSVACNSFDCSKAELFTKWEIQKHLKYLKDTLWLDQIVIEEENECYVNCATILLKGEQQVQQEICSEHQSHSKQSDFIRVGGFKTPGKFWIAKQPLSTPFSDFLENVQERKISVIVTLNDNIFTWPNEDHPEMGIGNDVTLKYKFIKKMRVYDMITLELITKTTSEILDVISFKKWPAPVVSLPKVDDFLNFVKESNGIFQNTEPVLVTCHDGRTSCGLYLAASYNVQQIKTENICDVCTCVRTVRRHCQDFVKDDEQYIYLVEAAHNYMKEFSLYEVK